jgi:two-component system cell cycle response regulator DivK
VIALVVEDDPPSAKLAARILRGAGCEVHVATTASDAARLVRDGLRPDVVIVDLDLPDLSGMDLIRVLRGYEATRTAPIIAVTASGAGFDEAAARRAGCNTFLRKPIDRDTLRGAVGILPT